MFVAVREDKRDRAALKCMFMRRSEVCRVEYIGEDRTRFALITLCGTRGWRELGRICGKGAARIVSASPVDDRYAGRFEPSAFLRAMLFNTAIRLTEAMDSPEKRLDIAVVDVFGVCAGFVGALALRCRRLRVLTCRDDRYRVLRHRLLCSYGAVLTVSDASAAVTEKLCLMGSGELPADGAVLRVSGKPASPSDFLLAEPEVPDWAAELIPPGLSPRDVLGAMYEINREERCGELCAAKAEDSAGTLLDWSAAQAAILRLLET